MKRWFKISFDDVFFNGLTANQIGILVKYRCHCQQFGVDELNSEQLNSCFVWKERQFLIQFLTKKGQLHDNFRNVFEQKKSKTGQLSECFGAKQDKNGNFLLQKNNNLTIYNNIDNNIKEKKEKRDRENSGEPPNKKYAFEGKIIKLNFEDFEKWKKAYPELNLNAELMQRDLWMQEQPPDVQKKWFLSTSQFFIKQNDRRKAQHDELNSADNSNERWYL